MQATIVDRYYGEFKALVSHLEKQGEVSLQSAAVEHFRKTLLLAAASYFEHRISEGLLTFVDETSKGNELVLEFVKNKAISRQYHTFFDWDVNNANRFFALFGQFFGSFMKREVQSNAQLDAAVKAFLEIGRERNRLIHQDFGTFSLEKTADEIYKLYKDALEFVETIPDQLKECLKKNTSAT